MGEDRPGGRHLPAEPQEVRRVRVHIEAVATGGSAQPATSDAGGQARLESPTQHPHAAMHGIDRAVGWLLAPYGVHDLGDSDRLATASEKDGEHRPLLRSAQLDLLVTQPCPYRAQHGQPQSAARHAMTVGCG